MKPVVIIGGRRAGMSWEENSVRIAYFFPRSTTHKEEAGEIELIDGDVPRILVKAGSQVEVDRQVIERKEDPKMKHK